jgi:hypothetical protein
MRRVGNHQQLLLIDPFDHLGPKRKALLETSWAGLFRESLFEKIPVEEIQAKFHSHMGRPTKDLRMMLGVLILQQMFNLTDEETCHQFSFNTAWHYALNIITEDDDSKYLCERTLRNYRALMIELELDEILFRLLTDTLLDKLKISTGKQRIDSTHIRSNMRRLSRLELFRKTIAKFLKVMRKEHPRLLQKHIEAELVERYLGEKNGYFSYTKPSEAKETLQQAAQDLLVLVETFRMHPKIKKMGPFGLLQRVLEEQCHVSGEGDGAKVELKDPKEVSSDSLQNPSDPDAGYSGHKGEGYQAQIMETYQETPDGTKSDIPNLITYVEIEPANHSDSDAVAPAIKETKERGCAPEELLADSLYGSDNNVQKAKEAGTELIAPTMGKPKSKEERLILDDFAVDKETGEVTACSAGETPCEIRRGKNGGLRLYFDPATCEACEYQDYCCVGLNSEHKLEYTPKQLRLAKRRVAEESEEFREKYRWRSGIEAVNAKLKQKLKIGRLRVRGIEKVRLAVKLKSLGWNIFQATKAKKARFSRFLLQSITRNHEYTELKYCITVI